MMTKTILKRVKQILNLRKNDVTFIESDGVKYEKDIELLPFNDI